MSEPDEKQIAPGMMALLQCTASELGDYSEKLRAGYEDDVRRVYAAMTKSAQVECWLCRDHPGGSQQTTWSEAQAKDWASSGFEVIALGEIGRLETNKYMKGLRHFMKVAPAFLAANGEPQGDDMTTQKPQHDSDCSIHNAGEPTLLGPCDCSLAPDGGTMKTAAVPEHWDAVEGAPKPGNPLLETGMP